VSALWLEEPGEIDERRSWPCVSRLGIADRSRLPASRSWSGWNRLLSVASVTCVVQRELEIDGRLSWTATIDGKVILQWIALVLPNDGLDLVSVSADDMSKSVLRDATGQLVPLVLAVAQDLNKRRIHCLVSDRRPALCDLVLSDFGFRSNVRLQAWTTDRCVSGDDDRDIRTGKWSAAQAELGQEVITALVAGCLEGSLDLSGMDAPTAEQLLNNWGRLPDLMSCILLEGTCPVGLALMGVEENAQVATIEYLGVIHSERCQGRGKRLLDQVCRTAMTPQARADGQQLKVYCDVQNVPALALYRSSGFSRQESYTLWVHSGPVTN